MVALTPNDNIKVHLAICRMRCDVCRLNCFWNRAWRLDGGHFLNQRTRRFGGLIKIYRDWSVFSRLCL